MPRHQNGKGWSVFHRYRATLQRIENAKSMLASVIEGGSDSAPATYHFSHIKMPPAEARVPVTKAEAGVLADYVLSFK